MQCSVSECEKSLVAKGMCDAHYRRLRKWGDPLAGPRAQRPKGLTESETFAWFMPGDPPTDGCWDWSASLDDHGYGQVAIGRKPIGAHVLSYRVHHGSTNGLFVLHSCDRPMCVHPAHLHLGTNADNMLECFARGRAAIGERHGNSTLTEADVRMIRESSASQRSTAQAFGISQATVSRIRSGATWKHSGK